ncbi:hypothetical protein [Halococcus sp. AFM35]|uniref:hypothetical protein n=1 Tax=Halococcus sp. AFM35 TaxID=3421653 RepID=UPI003EC07B71
MRYDGAPEDALLGALFSLPALLVAGTAMRWLVGAALCLSVAYALVRRRVPEVTERLVGFVPAEVGPNTSPSGSSRADRIPPTADRRFLSLAVEWRGKPCTRPSSFRPTAAPGQEGPHATDWRSPMPSGVACAF